MPNIYYLTRSFAPYQKGGGPLMREYAVDLLRELEWKVTVVMPNYHDKEIRMVDSCIQIPFFHHQKFASLLEKIGFYEDYLDLWVDAAYSYLEDKVAENDILFASAGGDLATIKLGSLLKKKIGCTFIINFRDPIVYTLVHGLKVDNKPHVSREKVEKKYISNADYIITSSKSYAQALLNKYPFLSNKIMTNYFGYMKGIKKQKKRSKHRKLRIAYSGSMRGVQKPEILYKAWQKMENKEDVELFFIGDMRNYKPVRTLPNVTLIPYMQHDKFLDFMHREIDIGFVSLSSDYLGACVPSKIYEYINLSLPILAALPKGDAQDIINKSNFGIACEYHDIEGLAKAIENFLEDSFFKRCVMHIEENRERWSMKERIKEVDIILRELS